METDFQGGFVRQTLLGTSPIATWLGWTPLTLQAGVYGVQKCLQVMILDSRFIPPREVPSALPQGQCIGTEGLSLHNLVI